MTNIETNAAYQAATATLAQLSAALASARTEEARLFAELAKTPGASADPLSEAMALLGGTLPARANADGLNQSLAVVRQKISTLAAGVEAQTAVVKTVRDQLSATVCKDAQQGHAEAAQSIADCLVALGQAMAVERNLRAVIEAAGYRCSLVAMAEPSIDFEDPQSVANRFIRTCQAYAQDTADSLSGTLDKPATVRLLRETEQGLPDDVLSLPGREARLLTRMGGAEPSRDKPHRVARLQSWQTEAVLA